MKTEILTDAQIKIKQIAIIFCFCSILIAAMALIGWQIDNETFKRISSTSVAMNPLSAICFIILSILIVLVKNENPGKQRKKTIQILSLFVLQIALFKLIFTLLNTDFQIDKILFHHKIYDPISRGPNVMATSSTICFIALSFAFLLMDYETKTQRRPGQYIALAITFLTLLIVYGYVYDVRYLYGTQSIITMGVNSALCFLMVSVAILFSRPNKGTISIIISDHTTEIVLLRFLAVFLPLILGYIKLKSVKGGYISQELATAMFALVTYALAMFLLGRKSIVQFRLKKMKSLADRIIREDAEKLKAIMDNSNAAIYIRNRAGEFVNINTKYEDILGLKREYIHRKKSINTASNNLGEFEDDHSVFETGQSIYKEEIIETGGKSINLLTIKFPLKDSKGRVTSVCNISTDITTLKQYETELKEKEKRLKAILDNVGEGVVVADTHGDFILFNQMAEEILGIGELKTKPKDWAQNYFIYYPDGKTPFPSDMLPLSLALQGIYVDEEEVLICNPKFSQCKRISITGRPIRREDGKFDGVVVFRDVTQKRELQAEINDQIMELEEHFQFIQSLKEHSPYFIFIYDLEKNQLTFQTKNLATKLGYPLSQISSLSENFFEAILHPMDIEKKNSYLKNNPFEKNNKVSSVELTLKDNTNTYHKFTFCNTEFKRNEDGKVTQLIGIAIEEK